MTVRRLLPFLAIAVLLFAPGCGGTDEIPLPDLTPFEPELQAKVHEIRDLTAEVRELEPGEEISEGTLTRDALTVFYEEWEAQAREEETSEIEAFNIAYRLLHFIGPDDDLLDLYAGMYSSEAIGLYSGEEDKLVLVTESEPVLDLDAEFTLSHEYVHSFQYANFDIDQLDDMAEKEEEEEHNTEYSTTISALMEGDAMLGSYAYMSRKLGYQGFLDWLSSPSDDATEDDKSYPPALERYFYFPYSYGTEFVLYLWRKGGWEEVNKAYSDPPSTTEQIIHPDKYLKGEKADALVLTDLSDALGDGWEETYDGVFGEFDVYNYLLTAAADDVIASIAAEGWGGGRIAIYANQKEQDRALIHLLITWDTEDDASEFVGAYLAMVPYLYDGAYSFTEELDSRYYEVMWDGDEEHLHAWWDGDAFTMLIGTDRDDVVSALAALDPTAAHRLAADDIPRGSCP